MKAYIFTSTYCTACKKYVPIFEKILKHYGIEYDTVNTVDDPDTANHLDVSVLPSVVFIDEEGFVYDVASGGKNEKEFSEIVKEFI